MTFDQLLSGVGKKAGMTMPATWAQGRATFGGLAVALAYERMAAEVSPERILRSLQVSFVAPVVPGEPAQFQARVLRQGKAVTQVLGEILQAGEPRLVCLASFAGSRESAVQVAPPPAPVAPAPGECLSLAYIPGVTPEFVRHIDMRWAFGHFPFSGKGGREMGGWMRFREPPENFSDAHVIALVDAWPPAVLPHLKSMAPSSSLTWSLDILHPRPQLAPGDWLLYKAVVDQAGAGYGHTQACVWTASGELVALSRQTVAVFG